MRAPKFRMLSIYDLNIKSLVKPQSGCSEAPGKSERQSFELARFLSLLGISPPFFFLLLFPFEVLVQRHPAQATFKHISVASNVCILAFGLIAYYCLSAFMLYILDLLNMKVNFPHMSGSGGRCSSSYFDHVLRGDQERKESGFVEM